MKAKKKGVCHMTDRKPTTKEKGLTYDYKNDRHYVIASDEALDYLKGQMLRKGRTQEDLSAEIGLSKQHLRELLNGRDGMKSEWAYDMVINMCIALDFTTRQMDFIWRKSIYIDE